MTSFCWQGILKITQQLKITTQISMTQKYKYKYWYLHALRAQPAVLWVLVVAKFLRAPEVCLGTAWVWTKLSSGWGLEETHTELSHGCLLIWLTMLKYRQTWKRWTHEERTISFCLTSHSYLSHQEVTVQWLDSEIDWAASMDGIVTMADSWRWSRI